MLTARVLTAGVDNDEILAALDALETEDAFLCRSRIMRSAIAEHGNGLFPGVVWFVVRDEAGPAAVGPLQVVRETDGGLRALALCSLTRFEFLYSDFAIRRDVDPGSVGQAVLATRIGGVGMADVLRVTAAPPNSDLAKIVAALSPNDHVVRAGSSLLPCIVNGRSWEEALTKNMRGHLRGSERKLRALGELSIVESTSGQSVIDAFERFVSLEGAGYKAALNPLIREEWDRKVLLEVIAGHAAAHRANILELFLNERLIASQLGVVEGDRLHLLKVAYDEELSSVSPGTFLLAELLRRRAADGRARVVDCCVRQVWHDRWHPILEDRISGTVSNYRTPKGALIGALRATRRAVARLRQWFVARNGYVAGTQHDR